MCSVFGYVNFRGISEKDLPNCFVAASKLQHRGPDESGYEYNEHVFLHHNRLAIQDLTSGQQPMVSFSKNTIIVFNGEIYNQLHLRRLLIKKGARFKTTNSDTEVIVNGYEQYGKSFFSMLQGIFCFIIYDKVKNLLLVARDSVGVKPCYYHRSGNEFIVASEIKAILHLKR